MWWIEERRCEPPLRRVTDALHGIKATDSIQYILSPLHNTSRMLITIVIITATLAFMCPIARADDKNDFYRQTDSGVWVGKSPARVRRNHLSVLSSAYQKSPVPPNRNF